MLEAVQLTKFHGEHPALRQVSFALQPGEVMALLGPNGAGKTTLLHLLALLTRPTSGTVRIDGVEMTGAPRQRARARIGLLGHQTFLYDELTARENLHFYARLYDLNDGTSRSEAQLELVGLKEVGDELVRHYSRGMRQRLALARVFLHEPPVLLLDEPFTGLDEASSRMLAEQIRRWRDYDRVVVFSSHDAQLANTLATSMLQLDRGRAFNPQSAIRNPQCAKR